MGQFQDVGSNEKSNFVGEEEIGLLSESTAHPTRLGKVRSLIASYNARPASISGILSYIRHLFVAFLRFLVPSFLTASANPSSEKINKLSVITGCRGLFCLIVFHSHFLSVFLNYVLWIGAWNGRHLLYQLPFLRLFAAGRAAVFVFWVIAGYTISLKPWKQLANKEHGAFQKSLSSTLIRRGFRLYLPPLASVLIIAVFVGLGLCEAGRHIRFDVIYEKENFYELSERFPELQPSLFGQIWHAIKACGSMFKIFSEENTQPDLYNPHLWCISLQYKMSLLMIMLQLAASRMTDNHRYYFLLSVVLLSIFVLKEPQYTAPFGGMFLAEVDTRYAFNQPKLPTKDAALEVNSGKNRRQFFGSLRTSKYTYLALLICGWFFCSTAPLETHDQLLLGPLITRFQYFFDVVLGGNEPYIAIGAVCMTYGIIHCELVHRLFVSRISLYLGKISFSLYLVHGIMLRMILYPLLPFLYEITGTQGPASDSSVTALQFFGTWTMSIVIMLPLTICAADVFHRTVESWSSDFAFYIDCKVSGK
ncbi:hypothetical protein K461DRAFT_278390 [Myriangium duriaei CBS 260.36]|uniref:Acyltransferase 3 domain-containing protein n=1 Tax=Myriangium duriaei CBS 260.36 TaxID=1168546 RepID=A0A9P4MNC6_9PEZI|nr:hypothetical protein K461DRAFT_278390 [Myriangium duriaei CBS 260.36]